MEISREALENMEVIYYGNRVKVVSLNFELGMATLEHGILVSFDNVRFYLDVDSEYTVREQVDMQVMVERQELLKKLSVLKLNEKLLEESKETFRQTMIREREAFSRYVTSIMYNLNKIVQSIIDTKQRVDEMKKPDEDYLEYESSVLKRAKKGQL